MGLYRDLGIQDQMKRAELEQLLHTQRDRVFSMINDPDPRRRQDVEIALKKIDLLIGALDRLDEKFDRPTLVMKTLAKAMDRENPQYAHFEDTILNVCNGELSVSYLKNPLNYLYSIGAIPLEEEWEYYLDSIGAEVLTDGFRINRIVRSDSSRRGNLVQAIQKGLSGAASSLSQQRAGSSGAARQNNVRRGQQSRTQNAQGGRGRNSRNNAGNIPAALLEKLEEFIERLNIPYLNRIPTRIISIALIALVSILLISMLVTQMNRSSAARKERKAAEAAAAAEEQAQAQAQALEQQLQSQLQGITNYSLLTDQVSESGYTMVVPSSCEASSTLVGTMGKVYGTEYLFDRNTETSWQEGEAGDGIGTTIYTVFPAGTQIRAIGIWTGNQTSEDSFYANNRPTLVNLSASYNGTTANTDVRLSDKMGEQLIIFEQPVPADNILLTLKEVARGTVYSDTVISEITWFTMPAEVSDTADVAPTEAEDATAEAGQTTEE